MRARALTLTLTLTLACVSSTRVFHHNCTCRYGKEGADHELRIGFDEVYNFFMFLKDIELFDLAVNATMQMRDDSRLLEEDLEHIALAVSGQAIGPHLAGVVFTMFDLDKPVRLQLIDPTRVELFL